MASSAAKKAAVTKKRPAASKKATATRKRRARMLIDDVTAILLISPNAKKLCKFYRATLGLPLEEEVHDGMPLHYGCSLGDVHFAIHSADGGWPGVPTRNAQSPIITFSTSDLKAVAKRLSAAGVKVAGPTDHGFGHVVSFRDPDGNFVSVLEYGPEYW
jgi:predicted enzyme related to lactoylglutathione lyase